MNDLGMAQNVNKFSSADNCEGFSCSCYSLETKEIQLNVIFLRVKLHFSFSRIWDLRSPMKFVCTLVGHRFPARRIKVCYHAS